MRIGRFRQPCDRTVMKGVREPELSSRSANLAASDAALPPSRSIYFSLVACPLRAQAGPGAPVVRANRGHATPDSCDWSKGRFPSSLHNGVAGKPIPKENEFRRYQSRQKTAARSASGSRHRRLSSIFPQRLGGHAEGPKERAAHAFAVRKTRFLRDHFNRVPPFLDHEPGSF
jgi:hypothetical protein